MDERSKFLKRESHSSEGATPNVYKNVVKRTKLPQIAAALKESIPDVPDNLLDILNNFHCVWCGKFIPNLKFGLSHFNSESHQRNMRLNGSTPTLFQLQENQIQDLETGVLIYANGSNRLHIIDPISKAKTEEIKISEKIEDLDMQYCTTCSVSFTSSINALKHYGGKKHKKNFFSKLTAPSRVSTNFDDNRCDICNVTTCTDEALQVHLGGKPHEKRVEKVIEENNMRSQPPDVVARLGVIDYDCPGGRDESYRPYDLPRAFFDDRYRTPHVRLNQWWQRDTQRQRLPDDSDKSSPTVVPTRYDCFNMPEILLQSYLQTLYK